MKALLCTVAIVVACITGTLYSAWCYLPLLPLSWRTEILYRTAADETWIINAKFRNRAVSFADSARIIGGFFDQSCVIEDPQQRDTIEFVSSCTASLEIK